MLRSIMIVAFIMACIIGFGSFLGSRIQIHEIVAKIAHPELALDMRIEEWRKRNTKPEY